VMLGEATEGKNICGMVSVLGFGQFARSHSGPEHGYSTVMGAVDLGALHAHGRPGADCELANHG